MANCQGVLAKQVDGRSGMEGGAERAEREVDCMLEGYVDG